MWRESVLVSELSALLLFSLKKSPWNPYYSTGLSSLPATRTFSRERLHQGSPFFDCVAGSDKRYFCASREMIHNLATLQYGKFTAQVVMLLFCPGIHTTEHGFEHLLLQSAMFQHHGLNEITVIVGHVVDPFTESAY